MHVLIWCPPWVGQGGDLFFGFNSFSKHLLLQAQTLQSRGVQVTVTCPSAYRDGLVANLSGLNVIEIDSYESIELIGSWSDPAPELYAQGEDGVLASRIAAWLAPLLPQKIDVILLWETPSSYLKLLYPDATIISQMPGAFARAPYPQTTVFDPVGLYKHGSHYKLASEILASQPTEAIVSSVAAKAKEIFYRYPYHSRDSFLAKSGKSKLTLLPLQISSHYAFKVDSGFLSQSDLCLSAIDKVSKNNALIVTEYNSRLYRDQVMSPEFTRFVQGRRPDLIFDPSMSSVSSISQHLLQAVDEIATSTSGLAFQAMLWDIPARVLGDTHILPFGSDIVNTSEKRQKVLSFLLNKHQPLNEAVTVDGKFLINVIEECHGRRNRQGLERLPDFNTIEPRYFDRVMASFREEEVERSYVAAGGVPRTPPEVEQFADLVAQKKPKLISFDLFDTLVTRGFEQPADLYQFIENDLRSRGEVVPFDFAEKRLSAELMARANAESEEISIDDIYNEFSRAEGLEEAKVTPLRDRELEIEVTTCLKRPIGTQLLAAAVGTNIPICITSDMYLPRETIDRIIVAAGLKDLAKVYLSSEVGLTKKSGALFDYIAKDRGLDATQILHVGDNIRTDVMSAEKKGVTPLHVPRAVERFWAHNAISSSFSKRRPPITSLGRSVTTAAIARTLFDDSSTVSDSISGGDPWKLGYATVGPMVYGFVAWLRASAVEHGIQELHFLSREGKILKDVFDRIELEAPCGIKSSYLWGSRRAIRIAQMQTLSDIIEVGKQTVDRSATLGAILSSRFGLDIGTLDESKLKAAGYRSLKDKIDPSPFERIKLVNLLTSLQEEILQRSRAEGEVYRAYLKHKGLYGDKKFAVVDVGWNANMQGSLGQILGKPFTGYYFATLAAATRWKSEGHRIHAYYVEDCTLTDTRPILSNRLMVENLLCDVSPTIQSIQLGLGGTFKPKYAGKTSSARLQLIRAVQDGARSFANDICRSLGGLAGSTEVQPDIALPLLEQFLMDPHPHDAALFQGHELEDAFSGSQQRYLLAPIEKGRPTQPSYWRAGEAALVNEKSIAGKGLPLTHMPSSLYPRPLLIHRLIMPLVRPIVRKLGNSADVKEFNASPAAFFAKLKNPWYRRAGALLFPFGKK